MKRLSRTLAQRAKLTPDQLERVKGQAGNGLAARYSKDGVLDIILTRKLAKARRNSARYVLYTDQLGKRMYLSADTKGMPLTFEKKEALTFVEGWDEPAIKKQYWYGVFERWFAEPNNSLLKQIRFQHVVITRAKTKFRSD